ncbi:hypothetical protein EJB05_58072, partial [Eragrostis curvula]
MEAEPRLIKLFTVNVFLLCLDRPSRLVCLLLASPAEEWRAADLLEKSSPWATFLVDTSSAGHSNRSQHQRPLNQNRQTLMLPGVDYYIGTPGNLQHNQSPEQQGQPPVNGTQGLSSDENGKGSGRIMAKWFPCLSGGRATS